MTTPEDYVMSVRDISKGCFIPAVGKTHFLLVPEDIDPDPKHGTTASAWCQAVIAASRWKNIDGQERGDILFIVHGYNMSEKEVMDRHRRIKTGLRACGFLGVVVSFDWPSGAEALAYLPDRHRAKVTALSLVNDGIRQLSARQTPDCQINIHLLGHSTGVYVIREAFDDADDTQLRQSSWLVSQIVFAAGDVSSESMTEGNSGAVSIYRHCVRLTNYSNLHDSVLDISNVKRVGVAPRVGRIGLPAAAPQSSVNVDCSEYYLLLDGSQNIQIEDEPLGRAGAPCHSWYFGNTIFTRDLFETIIGFPSAMRKTRLADPNGKLHLIRDK
jgi:esterase/lipase superfamily enzyme